ncbi:hypothetical protein ACFX12_008825 [Malus domestica]
MYMYECLGPAATKGLSHKPNSVEKKHKTQISPKQHQAHPHLTLQATPRPSSLSPLSLFVIYQGRAQGRPPAQILALPGVRKECLNELASSNRADFHQTRPQRRSRSRRRLHRRSRIRHRQQPPRYDGHRFGTRRQSLRHEDLGERDPGRLEHRLRARQWDISAVQGPIGVRLPEHQPDKDRVAVAPEPFDQPGERFERRSDEENYLVGLTRQIARSTFDDEFKYSDPAFAFEKPKGWVASGSPQSTLCAVGSGCDCGQGSSRGSPNASRRRPPGICCKGNSQDAHLPKPKIIYHMKLLVVQFQPSRSSLDGP